MNAMAAMTFIALIFSVLDPGEPRKKNRRCLVSRAFRRSLNRILQNPASI
jgi:hypothetical protein